MSTSEHARPRAFTLVATLTTVVAATAAGCSRPPQRATPAAGEGRAARFDSATVARLCATPDSATLVVGGCELRDQAPPPRARPRPGP